MRLTSTRRWLIILVLILVVPAQFVLGAKSKQPSRVTLKRNLRNVQTQIRDVRRRLHDTKRKHRKVTHQLIATQQRLDAAQDRVSSSKLSLLQAKSQYEVITQRLTRTQRKLSRRGKLLSRRLVDIYQGDDIGYVDVLLGSRDMKTFMSRGYYVRQIVTTDVDLIKEIKKDRDQVEQDKKAQASEVRRIAFLQAQLIRERNSIAGLADEKQAQLDTIENDRELYERMLSELMAESSRIAYRIRSLQATPKGRKRYARRFTGGLGLPASGRITSRFGYRIHPITRVRSLHTGVDIACPTGTPVHAAANGEVIMAGWMGPYGNAIVIDHGGGVSTLYGHNSRLLVGVGQQVSKGQVICRVGSTGWSTGPHLHFEKRVNGRPVRPM